MLSSMTSNCSFAKSEREREREGEALAATMPCAKASGLMKVDTDFINVRLLVFFKKNNEACVFVRSEGGFRLSRGEGRLVVDVGVVSWFFLVVM